MVSYYTMSFIFLLAFGIESIVTGKLFLNRQHIPVTGFMRWWAVFSLGLISVVNILGFLRLRANHLSSQVDIGNYLQALFALSSLSLVAWVLIFHVDRWKEK